MTIVPFPIFRRWVLNVALMLFAESILPQPKCLHIGVESMQIPPPERTLSTLFLAFPLRHRLAHRFIKLDWFRRIDYRLSCFLCVNYCYEFGFCFLGRFLCKCECLNTIVTAPRTWRLSSVTDKRSFKKVEIVPRFSFTRFRRASSACSHSSWNFSRSFYFFYA